MSGKLFNFLCSQLERKNSRRTIDLSVNLIFRRIHVYQNGHVPIYRFPSVFFIFFSQKEFFYVDKWHNISNRTGLEPVPDLNFLLCDFIHKHTTLLFQTLVHDFSLLLPNRKDSED